MIGLPLAIWRSTVAERQSATSQLQSETAQRGLLNERYQKGAEMLGSAVLAVRLGGIYALDRLAREHPEAYHLQIMNLLCAFVRNPTTVEYLGGEAPRDGHRYKLSNWYARMLRQSFQPFVAEARRKLK